MEPSEHSMGTFREYIMLWGREVHFILSRLISCELKFNVKTCGHKLTHIDQKESHDLVNKTSFAESIDDNIPLSTKPTGDDHGLFCLVW